MSFICLSDGLARNIACIRRAQTLLDELETRWAAIPVGEAYEHVALHRVAAHLRHMIHSDSAELEAYHNRKRE